MTPKQREEIMDEKTKAEIEERGRAYAKQFGIWTEGALYKAYSAGATEQHDLAVKSTVETLIEFLEIATENCFTVAQLNYVLNLRLAELLPTPSGKEE